MSNPVLQAQDLLAEGKIKESITVATQAAEDGDSSALALIASWRMIGSPLPRDLGESRKLLRRAVQIGHVDAALMEVALTANGTGAPPDWSGAVSLLRMAANCDPVAAEQRKILNAMSLDDRGNSLKLPEARIVHSQPEISIFPNFVSAAEAAHIAHAVSDIMEPSMVLDPVSGRQILHPVRISHNAAIGPSRESLVVQAINRRIATVTSTSVDQGEPLTILHYALGQEYKPHLDTLSNEQNQRIATAILYLNDSFLGGQTIFPLLSLTITPRTGDLLVFRNVDQSGSPDPLTRHAGMPVTAGNKWIATRWIRTRPYNLWSSDQ